MDLGTLWGLPTEEALLACCQEEPLQAARHGKTLWPSAPIAAHFLMLGGERETKTPLAGLLVVGWRGEGHGVLVRPSGHIA